MHDQIGFLLQKVAQEKTSDEPGRPGQHDFPKISRRHGIARWLLPDRLVNGPAHDVHVSLALRRQRPNERRDFGVGGRDFSHICPPSDMELGSALRI